MQPARQLEALRRHSDGEGPGDVEAAAECCPLHYCRLHHLQIECSHGERNYVLEVAPGSMPVLERPRFEILASATVADEIRISAAGQCGYGRTGSAADALQAALMIRNSREYCPSVVIRGPGVEVIRPGDVRVNLFAPAVAEPGNDVPGFLRAALLPDRRRQRYRLSTWGCQGEPGGILAEVVVHNRQSWQADFSLTWRPGKKASPDAARSPGRWDWRGRLEANLGDHHWKKSFGGKPHNRRNDSEQGLFPGLRNILEKRLSLLLDLADEYDNIRLHWPDIRFSGRLQRQELPDGPAIADAWEIRLSLSPLLGADVQVDIFDFLVRSSHPYGVVLGRIKDRLEKGIGAERVGLKAAIRLLLRIGGSAGGELHWQQPAGQESRRDGLLEAGLRFGGEASVDVKGSVFLVRMAGQASLKSASADSSRRLSEVSGYCAADVAGDEPVIRGGLRFNGLAIYYTLFLQIGIEEIRDRAPAAGNTATIMARLADAPEYRHQSSDRLFTLLEPWQWPGDERNGGLPVADYMHA